MPAGERPAIHPGWLVVYRDPDGKLRGGVEDPAHGTIAHAEVGPQGWMFRLTDGTTLEATAVTETTADGGILAGWTTRQHGLHGKMNARHAEESKARQEPGTATPNWLKSWQELAALTNGIARDDPHFPAVLKAVDRCDDAYLAGRWAAFLEVAEEVKRLVSRER
jgi:hypothetical protein